MRLPDAPEFAICERCPLCNNIEAPRRPIAGEGAVPARLMIVGEAPGAVERRVGRPFQGPAGQQLTSILEEAGVAREDVYITNMVRQHPLDGGKTRKPTFAELTACRPWLDQELARVDPRVVLLVGGTAHQLAFPGQKPHQCVGKARQMDGRTWLAAYHPAFILHKRDPKIRELILDVVKQAVALCR